MSSLEQKPARRLRRPQNGDKWGIEARYDENGPTYYLWTPSGTFELCQFLGHPDRVRPDMEELDRRIRDATNG